MLSRQVPNQLTRCAGAIITAALLTAIFVLAMPANDAGAQSSNPCPRWSIQGVFADPNGDWDRDRVPNGTELDHGENPCVPVKASFCNEQPVLCTVQYVPASSACSYGTYWTRDAVNRAPNADWDNDGVSNKVEADGGANPCSHPCPRPTKLDVSLNPWGDWDRDGIANTTEVYYGTNPCIRKAPAAVITPATPKPAPVVVYVYAQPTTPPAGLKCPAGFPYYYAHTRLCHASLIR